MTTKTHILFYPKNYFSIDKFKYSLMSKNINKLYDDMSNLSNYSKEEIEMKNLNDAIKSKYNNNDKNNHMSGSDNIILKRNINSAKFALVSKPIIFKKNIKKMIESKFINKKKDFISIKIKRIKKIDDVKSKSQVPSSSSKSFFIDINNSIYNSTKSVSLKNSDSSFGKTFHKKKYRYRINCNNKISSNNILRKSNSYIIKNKNQRNPMFSFYEKKNRISSVRNIFFKKSTLEKSEEKGNESNIKLKIFSTNKNNSISNIDNIPNNNSIQNDSINSIKKSNIVKLEKQIIPIIKERIYNFKKLKIKNIHKPNVLFNKSNSKTLEKKERKLFFKKIKILEKNINIKQKQLEHKKNEKYSRNNSMFLLKSLNGTFFKDIELECKKAALSYRKKVGQFYRAQNNGLYTSHFFTLLKRDKFFGNNHLLQKTPNVYHHLYSFHK